MTQPELVLYIIHRRQLTTREARLHGTIQSVRTLAQEAGYQVRPIMILGHDPEDLYPRLNDLQAKTKYDPTGVPDLDSKIEVLSLDQISNIEKHKDAWGRICEHARGAGATAGGNLYMVMEDDAMFMPELGANMVELLRQAPEAPWDILFMGLTDADANAAQAQPLALRSTRDRFKILAGKEAYLVRPPTAMHMLDRMATYTFPIRLFLSHYIETNPLVRAMHPNRRVSLEGSKVGICPSSLHGNNVLVLNREYINMLGLLQAPQPAAKPDVDAAYARVAHLRSPDAMHLYGVLLFRAGDAAAAEKVLLEAIDEIHRQQGFLSNQSDLFQNLIMIYGHLQPDLEEYAKLPPRYATKRAKAAAA